MSYRDTLLQAVQIGGRVAKNRFFSQPMECADADDNGNPTELTYRRYENLFRGGWGLIDLEAISITQESRSRKNQLLIRPQNAPALARFIKRMREVNPEPLIVFQLTHSGELSNPDFSRRVTVCPSYTYGGDLLSDGDVDRIMNDFVQAAKIAQDVGADGIDMKLCHGYLGSQILRPFNTRNWKYGGKWENRRQFAFDLYERIAGAVDDPKFLIGSKVSAWEGFPGGFGTDGPDSAVIDLTEPLDLVKGLEERGAQYVVQSAGSPSITISLTQAEKNHPYIAYLHPTFQKAFKAAMKRETVLIGSNYSVWGKGNQNLQMVPPEDNSMLKVGAKNIDRGIVDMIGLGRQSFADPLLPSKLEQGNERDMKFCTLCDNCLELLIRQKPIGCCTFNQYYTDVLVDVRKHLGKLQQNHT